MTAAELYETDLTFRCLINSWVQERRCPLPAVDRCLEFGLEAAAEACRWAATEPMRPTWHEAPAMSHPYPQINSNGCWYWMGEMENIPLKYSHRIPKAMDRYQQGLPDACDVAAAILWLLDNWQPTEVPV